MEHQEIYFILFELEIAWYLVKLVCIWLSWLTLSIRIYVILEYKQIYIKSV